MGVIVAITAPGSWKDLHSQNPWTNLRICKPNVNGVDNFQVGLIADYNGSPYACSNMQ